MLLAFLAALSLQAKPPVTELLRLAEEKIQADQYSQAAPLLQQALQQDPSNTSALYRLAYCEFRERQLASSRVHFAAVVRIAPPALNSRYFLGRIALLENKPKEAIAWLEPVTVSRSSVYDADSQLAAAYLAAGLVPQAIGALKNALTRAPWDGALYYRLGQLYKQAGENELAGEAFGSSMRLKAASREDVETLMSASSLLAEGKPAEALKIGAKVQDRAGADPNALVALGVIYGNANLPGDAMRAFERAASLDKTSFQAHFNYGLALLKSGQAIQSLGPLTAALELLPQSVEAAMTLGLAAIMGKRYEGAIAPLEMARQRDAASPKLAALLGTAYLRTSRPKQAVRALRTAAAGATDPASLLLLMEALNATEATNEALDVARQAQKRFPGSAQCHMAAAQQLVRLGRYQEARSAFEQTLSLTPGRSEAELGLADVLQKAGQHQAAVTHYRAAGPTLNAALGLSRSLVALGRLDDARRILEGELQNNASDAALRQELSRVYARLGLPDLAAEQSHIAEQLRAP